MTTSKRNGLVLLLIVAAALIGLLIGRIAGRNAAERDITHRLTENGIFSSLGTNNSKLQSIITLIRDCYVDNVDVDSIEDVAIQQMLEELDPHSVYIPLKDVEKVTGELKSNFGGIGIQFTLRDDTVRVETVVTGGPSSALGMEPGDKIIKVNGYDFTGKWLTNQTVLDSLRGEIDTKVQVTVLRGQSTTIDYDIVRDVIPLTSVVSAYEIGKGVGYIKIDRFAEGTYMEMLMNLSRLKTQGCTKFIVDLRSNSGGYLNVVQDMCNEFLDRGEMIVYTEGVHQRRQETRATGSGSFRDVDLVVLIDEYSASASEIFAGAMQDNDRGTIIGRRSFGKGLVQSEMQLQDGSAIRLTVARYHTPSGRCIQRPYGHDDGEYYSDIAKRYSSGELFSADSIKADTSLVFYTTKGRKVYGGGGIVPDIFVPYDTAAASPYLYNLRARRMIYDFAKQNVGKLRPQLSTKPLPEMVHYLLSQNYMDGLEAYAEKHGVVRPKHLDAKERQIIENEVRAYIAQSINDEGGIYVILNSIDPVVERALEELGSKSLY